MLEYLPDAGAGSELPDGWCGAAITYPPKIGWPADPRLRADVQVLAPRRNPTGFARRPAQWRWSPASAGRGVAFHRHPGCVCPGASGCFTTVALDRSLRSLSCCSGSEAAARTPRDPGQIDADLKSEVKELQTDNEQAMLRSPAAGPDGSRAEQPNGSLRRDRPSPTGRAPVGRRASM